MEKLAFILYATATSETRDVLLEKLVFVGFWFILLVSTQIGPLILFAKDLELQPCLCQRRAYHELVCYSQEIQRHVYIIF